MREFDLEAFKKGEKAVTNDGNEATFCNYSNRGRFPVTYEVRGLLYSCDDNGIFWPTDNSKDLVGMGEPDFKTGDLVTAPELSKPWIYGYEYDNITRLYRSVKALRANDSTYNIPSYRLSHYKEPKITFTAEIDGEKREISVDKTQLEKLDDLIKNLG